LLATQIIVFTLITAAVWIGAFWDTNVGRWEFAELVQIISKYFNFQTKLVGGRDDGSIRRVRALSTVTVQCKMFPKISRVHISRHWKIIGVFLADFLHVSNTKKSIKSTTNSNSRSFSRVSAVGSVVNISAPVHRSITTKRM
jgi:hypothetical protein